MSKGRGDNRWPSWKGADGIGKFAYVIAAVWLLLLLAVLSNV